MTRSFQIFLRILGIAPGLLCILGSVQAQTVTKEDMASLSLVAGYTGVGTYPAIAIARPTGETNADNAPVEMLSLLTASAHGWQKKSFECVRGIAMSANGKYVWIIKNYKVDACTLTYDIALSTDGGKTWKSTQGNGFNTSSPAGSRFERLDVSADGKGRLVLWVDSPGTFFRVGITKFGLSIDSRPVISEATLARPMAHSIVAFSRNTFQTESANTLVNRNKVLTHLVQSRTATRSVVPAR